MTKCNSNGNIYVFGGYVESQCTNQLWVFNTDRTFWKNITPEQSPSGRANHADVVVEDATSGIEKIAIVVGVNKDLHRLNDFFLS